MEQKQKVWIRGNKTRNEEVIAKLVELGGIDTHFITGSAPNRIYFIDEKNRIDSIKDSSRVAKIMTEEYQEIKLDDSPSEGVAQDYSLKVSKDLSTFAKTCINIPEGTSVNISNEDGKFMIIVEPKEVKKEDTQFKKGDIVFLNVQGDNKIYQHLAIVKSIDKDKGVYFSVSFCINEHELSAIHESMWFSKEDIKSIRYATEEEKRTLFVAMLNKGLFLDENKMMVHKLKEGDVICTKIQSVEYISLFCEIKNGFVYSYLDFSKKSLSIHFLGGCSIPLSIVESIRFANTEERFALFNKIEEQAHKRWNAETKELKNIF